MLGMRIAVGACAWAALAGSAAAAGQDGALVATAPAGADAPTSAAAPSVAAKPAAAPADTTAQQIDAWIHRNDDGTLEYGGVAAPPQPRSIHGVVGAGFASNGSSYEYGMADIPVGRSGDLLVAASHANDRFRHGYGGERNSLSLGFFWDGAKPSDPCARHDRPLSPEDPARFDAQCPARPAE